MSSPHDEPLEVTDTDGLALPHNYVGHDGGLVVRTPTGATIDFKPRQWDGFVGNVLPRHFGRVNDDGPNDHLGANEVSLKKYGQAPDVYRVDQPSEVGE